MNFTDAFADIVALIMWEPRTRPQLMELTGSEWDTTNKRVGALHKYGVIYISSWVRTTRCSAWLAVYAMQSKPFALPDVPKPTPRKPKT